MGKITFFILSNTGKPVKQASFSRRSLVTLGIMGAIFAVLLGCAATDYFILKFTNKNPYRLEQRVKEFQSEIESQRSQIKKYAVEINELKTKLIGLNNFEKKLKVIANIDKGNLKNSIFSIGGAIPEDLDTEIPATERHNSLLRDMHEQIDVLDSAMDQQNEGFNKLYGYIEEQRNILESTPAIRPSKGWISSPFGYRVSPFTGQGNFHSGIDIANRVNTPVNSSADGVVSFVGHKGTLGLLVIIDHGHGMTTRYAHLSKSLMKTGESVSRGDEIALMGNSGRSTGPHLHYEVIMNGIPVNPVRYILN